MKAISGIKKNFNDYRLIFSPGSGNEQAEIEETYFNSEFYWENFEAFLEEAYSE